MTNASHLLFLGTRSFELAIRRRTNTEIGLGCSLGGGGTIVHLFDSTIFLIVTITQPLSLPLMLPLPIPPVITLLPILPPAPPVIMPLLVPLV
jgi:hypothetical protein